MRAPRKEGNAQEAGGSDLGEIKMPQSHIGRRKEKIAQPHQGDLSVDKGLVRADRISPPVCHSSSGAGEAGVAQPELVNGFKQGDESVEIRRLGEVAICVQGVAAGDLALVLRA